MATIPLSETAFRQELARLSTLLDDPALPVDDWRHLMRRAMDIPFDSQSERAVWDLQCKAIRHPSADFDVVDLHYWYEEFYEAASENPALPLQLLTDPSEVLGRFFWGGVTLTYKLWMESLGEHKVAVLQSIFDCGLRKTEQRELHVIQAIRNPSSYNIYAVIQLVERAAPGEGSLLDRAVRLWQMMRCLHARVPGTKPISGVLNFLP